jgi:type II secretion system protein G
MISRRVRTASERGFTIVELLIVIVVIAILAAISIVAYNGIQNRANDTAVQADLANISKKMQLYQADNGTYPVGTAGLTAVEDLKPSRGTYDSGYNNFVYCYTTTTGLNYAIVGKSKSGNAFFVSSTNGRGTVTLAGNAVTTQEACNQITPILTVGAGGSTAVGYTLAGGWATWVD